MEDKQKPSLAKQLLGALIGGTLAVVCYMAYGSVAPLVTAYVIPSGMDASLSGEASVADQNGYGTAEEGVRFQKRAESMAKILHDRTETVHAVGAELERSSYEEEEKMVRTDVVHSGAPNLPSSGWPLMIVVAGSYAGALIWRVRHFMRA